MAQDLARRSRAAVASTTCRPADPDVRAPPHAGRGHALIKAKRCGSHRPLSALYGPASAGSPSDGCRRGTEVVAGASGGVGGVRAVRVPPGVRGAGLEQGERAERVRGAVGTPVRLLPRVRRVALGVGEAGRVRGAVGTARTVIAGGTGVGARASGESGGYGGRVLRAVRVPPGAQGAVGTADTVAAGMYGEWALGRVERARGAADTTRTVVAGSPDRPAVAAGRAAGVPPSPLRRFASRAPGRPHRPPALVQTLLRGGRAARIASSMPGWVNVKPDSSRRFGRTR